MGILNSELDRERKKNAELEDRIAELEAEVARLNSRLSMYRKNIADRALKEAGDE